MPEEGLHLHGRVRTQAHECGENRRFGFHRYFLSSEQPKAALRAALQGASRNAPRL